MPTLIILKFIAVVIALWSGYQIVSGFAFRPSRRTLQKLNNIYVVRYTSRDVISSGNIIDIAPTVERKGNSSTLYKPAIWFFLDEPSAKDIWKNNIQKSEIKIKIPITALEEDKILIRKSDNALAYLAPYKGEAIIQESDFPIDTSFNLRRFYYSNIHGLVLLGALFGSTFLVSLYLALTLVIMYLIFMVIDLSFWILDIGKRKQKTGA